MGQQNRIWLLASVLLVGVMVAATGFLGAGSASAEVSETVTAITVDGKNTSSPSIASFGSAAAVAFVASDTEDGQTSSIYFAEEGASGWSEPVLISGSDARANHPSLAFSENGTPGVAWADYTAVDNIITGARVYFAERVDGTWTSAIVAEGVDYVWHGRPELAYIGETPHVVVVKSTDGLPGSIIDLTRQSPGEWMATEIDGPETTGEYVDRNEGICVDVSGDAIEYAWVRTDTYDTGWPRSDTRRIAVYGPGRDAAPYVPLPNPNDTADCWPFMKLDESGMMRLFFVRGESDVASPAYHAVEGASDWQLSKVANEVQNMAFEYEQGTTLCGYGTSSGFVVKQYTDGLDETITYEYPAGDDPDGWTGFNGLVVSDGQMWLATSVYDDWGSISHVEIRKRQLIVPAPNEDPPPVVPVAGGTRFDTAVEASKLAFPDGASTVVIATGLNWPDALGGTSLAGALDGPILLVEPGSVPASVTEEVERLGATKAIILGGEAAVSKAVFDALDVDLEVERIGGANRYQTAEMVAARTRTVLGAGWDGTAFVATGGNFPDALAAAPLASAQGWPLYLVNPVTGLSDATKAAMAGVTDAVILGGTGVVSEGTAAYLGSFADVTRLSGADRYATAVAVANYAVDEAGHGWNRVGITTGENFPDALAGGVLQGKVGSVMLLSHSASLTPVTGQAIGANKADIASVTYFGGTGAVSQAVRDAVAQLLE